jgi:hypothetical protein
VQLDEERRALGARTAKLTAQEDELRSKVAANDKREAELAAEGAR